MAIETFTWRPVGSVQGSVKFRALSAQFGDGYQQVAKDGINNRTSSWPLRFVGGKARVQAIQAFIDRHAGAKSFYWTPPLGARGLFRIGEYTPAVEAGAVYSLSATFVEAFAP
ncbi:phage tail protein [Ralstonia solanacearum]|uniref:Phage tail protein n=1 Tax=Ralstonia solanacearum TaxID=305 RepID=A0AAE3NL57_RALSL|nr:phage tail protein [Ralstonia solanacearum]MBB6581664.1 phage tail protein [Ralstonia solanacearum]MDB0523756.1 phage tail protein [Ralstonia solanacearum]